MYIFYPIWQKNYLVYGYWFSALCSLLCYFLLVALSAIFRRMKVRYYLLPRLPVSFTDSAPPSHTTAGRQVMKTLAGLSPAEYNSALQSSLYMLFPTI